MFHSISRTPSGALLFIFFLLSGTLAAQKAGLEVTRCSAVDRATPIKNVAVDASGRKWVANKTGIFQVKATDLATPVKLGADERNVLAYNGGNADFIWSESAFRRFVKEPCSVTAAWYDSKNQQLWLGTDEAGLFQFAVQPELKLVQQYKTVNSKLKSNSITTLFQDSQGRIWAGTDRGLMFGPPGKWKAELPNTEVRRIREFNTVIFVLADGYISKAPNGEKWSDLALNEKFLEGEIKDFDIDASGKMWLVSGHLTRFDMIANAYEEFSGPEYYTSQYGTCIAVDFDGAAWVGTNDKGLYVVDKAYNMVLNAYVDKPISCEGNGNDAVLMAKVTGGVPPYTYTWTGGLSGENPKNVPAGNYSVTVTDSKGKARNADIGVPDVRLKVKARQKKPVSAPGAADGAGEVDIANNASGIVVLWDNGENLAVATKLAAGEHTVTVTDPKGCSVVLKVTISEVAQAVSATVSERTKIKCAGEKAALTVEVKGGKAPFKYAWSSPAIQGDKPENVPAGDYVLTVTDATNATSTAAVSVKQPEPLIASALVQAPASTGGADGKALAQAKGGTGVYSFKWDNGETVFAATKLPPGNRSLTVTDANGCTAVANFTIMENVLSLAVQVVEKGAIKCAGDKSALSVEAKGGKLPYRYAWSTPTLSGEQPVNVTAGDYSVTVTDAMGNTQSATVKVKAPQPLQVSAIAQGLVSPGAADGKALAMTSGGTGAHLFKWDNGEITAATLALTVGLHTVTVTDENGCTATASVTMTESLLPLEAVVSEKSGIKCSGEKASLSVQVSGGKGPFKYAWSSPSLSGDQPSAPAGSYVLTVTDAVGNSKTVSVSVSAPAPLSLSVEMQSPASTGGADGKAVAKASGGVGGYTFKWENGESAATAARLAPGASKVTVTDANGCTAVASLAMTENVLPLEAAVSEKSGIKCSGEKASLSVQVSGGKGPFKYAWSSPSLSGDQPSAPAGSYVLTVTDAVGNSKTVSVSVSAPAPLSLSVEMQSPASAGGNDGKAIAKPTGGAGGYIFQWESGESTDKASRLSAGNVKVTVTDANGCTAVASVSVTENILPLSVKLTEKNNIKCGGLDKASLLAEVSGGKMPYSFKWSSPELSGSAPDGLAAGEYALTVTDAKGSSQTAKITVVAPEPLAIELVQNIGASSPTSTDGKAQVAVKGGTAPYKVAWDTKQTGTTVKLPQGKHSVTVTDAQGCAQSLDFETGKRAMPELTRAIEQGQTIPMRLLTFETDSFRLRPAVYNYLDELYDFLVENPKINIEVAGHTNNQPNDDFADYLSTARARAVAEYLIGKGIDSARVQYKGYGKRQPLVPNTTPEGRRTNQRVEIKILTAGTK